MGRPHTKQDACSCGRKKEADSSRCGQCYTQELAARAAKRRQCVCGKTKDARAAQCYDCRVNGAKVPSRPAQLEKNPPVQEKLVEQRIESAFSLEISKVVEGRVKSLSDLMAVCEVDETVWEVDTWECGKWEMAAMERVKAGTVSATGSPIVTQLFRIKAKFKRKSKAILTHQELNKALVADLLAMKPLPAPRFKRSPTGNWLFEFSPFDLHMGKLTWDGETPANYDTDIAEDLFNYSLDYLLERALKLADGKLDRVLCVFGNDVSHSDSKRGQTTGGTPLDMDSRFIKVFRRIVQVHVRALEILRGIAPVDVVIIPGNHDELASYFLGEVLEARYHDVPHITFDNGAKLRKYYEYGTNMWGFTHGNVESVKELGLTMAREEPQMWARCGSREWHVGHKHISENYAAKELPGRIEQGLFSDKGVRIRRLTSLSGHDFWHTQHAYMDRRAAEAFLFHKAGGFSEHMSCNVDHFTGKIISSHE